MSAVPDLVEAPVAERLTGAVARGPAVEASLDSILLRIPMVGRFLVVRGGPVTVERAPSATDADLSYFQREAVAAAAALVRGAIPLHAATVAIDGRAIAIAGASGLGKSAIAAALALRGHPVLADAVTVIDAHAPVIQPLAPDLVLWPDMVAELGLNPSIGELVRPALSKRSFKIAGDSQPAPLHAIVFLGRHALYREPAVSRLTGLSKTGALVGTCWYRRLVEELGLAESRFQPLAQIASATEFIGVVRPRDESSPAALATLVEELVR